VALGLHPVGAALNGALQAADLSHPPLKNSVMLPEIIATVRTALSSLIVWTTNEINPTSAVVYAHKGVMEKGV